MTIAVDTSVAIPLVVRSHHDHVAVVRWWNEQEIAIDLFHHTVYAVATGLAYQLLSNGGTARAA